MLRQSRTRQLPEVLASGDESCQSTFTKWELTEMSTLVRCLSSYEGKHTCTPSSDNISALLSEVAHLIILCKPAFAFGQLTNGLRSYPFPWDGIALDIVNEPYSSLAVSAKSSAHLGWVHGSQSGYLGSTSEQPQVYGGKCFYCLRRYVNGIFQ